MSSPYRITPALLRAAGAKVDQAEFYAPLLEHARFKPGDSYETISSKAGIAMLVAQLAHESDGFSRIEENLNYSARRLFEVFPKRFPTLFFAGEYAFWPEKIANRVYADRLGNGNEASGDGWKFRGSGLIQLTGRDNATRFGRTIGKSPEEAIEYCRTPTGAVASALWFWRSYDLLLPASRGDVKRCTQIINGGYIGLTERIALYHAVLAAF